MSILLIFAISWRASPILRVAMSRDLWTVWRVTFSFRAMLTSWSPLLFRFQMSLCFGVRYPKLSVILQSCKITMAYIVSVTCFIHIRFSSPYLCEARGFLTPYRTGIENKETIKDTITNQDGS